MFVRHSLTPCVDLTDVTLADEDTKSIPTDNAKRAIKGQCGNACETTWWPTLEPMLVGKPHVQILNQCKLWWLNLQLMQVAPSGGQICNQCKTKSKLTDNAKRAIQGNEGIQVM